RHVSITAGDSGQPYAFAGLLLRAAAGDSSSDPLPTFHRPSQAAPNAKNAEMQGFPRADAGTRTPDPLLTMEVLYRLSYVGAEKQLTASSGGSRIRTCVGVASDFTGRLLWPLGHT